MTQNIIRSGVPHAVTTSVVTHDAINPRNVLLESDKTPVEEETPREQPSLVKTDGNSSKSASAHPPVTANPENNKSESYTINQHFAEPKGEIKSNFQKVESQKIYQTNRQHLSNNENVVANHQKLNQISIQIIFKVLIMSP